MRGRGIAVAMAVAALLAATAARLLRSPPGPGRPFTPWVGPDGVPALPPRVGALPGAAVAAATAEDALRVLVLDGEGRPVEGAEVAASREGDLRPRRGTTDRTGLSLLGGLDRGAEYLVGARAQGLAPAMAAGARPGGEEVRLVLRPGVRLHGCVRLADGRPCPGARVRLSFRLAGAPRPLGGLETRADERGAWEFAGVPAIPSWISGDWNGCLGGPVPADPRADLRDGAADCRVDLVLDRGGTVAGTVRDGRGAPLGGVLVTALLPGTSRSVAAAETAPDGSFLLGGLEGRPHVVRAADPSRRRRPASTEGVVPPRDGLDFALEEDPAAPGTFAFRVVDQGGLPVRAVRLTEFVPSLSAPVRCGVDGPDEDGVLRSAQSEPGPRRILVRAGGGFAESALFGVERAAETDLGTLRLSPGAEVRGRLLGPDGAPATGASVFAGGDLLPERGMPDAAGRFAVAGLPPGEGRLRFVLSRCEVEEAAWRGEAGTVSDLGDVRLRPATGVVRGATRCSAGVVPAGARATLRPDGDGPPRGLERTTEVRPDGTFEFREVPAGRWYAGVLVPAAPPGGVAAGPVPSLGRAAPAFDLPEGGTREVEIVLR